MHQKTCCCTDNGFCCEQDPGDGGWLLKETPRGFYDREGVG